MTTQNIFPIKLEGDNLGHRHQHYNSLLNVTYERKVPISSLKNAVEESVIDHLFKIDAAAKYREVEYIIQELKSPDLIYANRAMKSWLLDAEFSHIINPVHLETELYPEMKTTAVTKLKHLIQLKLRDPVRCEKFYKYYKEKNFDEAFKFLSHCSIEVILSEVSSILDKLSPFRLKLLSEKCPEVAKMFYERLYSVAENDEEGKKMLSNYLKNQKKYFNSIKMILKVNGDIFLDIVEKCYHEHSFGRFNGRATKYIMRNHKDRFDRKPELYVAFFLNIETLAQCLTAEQIKETVFKLARANYLRSWFSYKNIEPFIKRLNFEERAVFKKLVFVDKSFGDAVEKCPYEMPSPPELKEFDGQTVFDDNDHDPSEYDHLESYTTDFDFRKKLKKRCAKYACMGMSMASCIKRKTSLDQLFDRFRFVGFDKALFDLRKEMKATSMHQRQNMMLVLVSKSGGRVENLDQLFQLLTIYKNEPENVRATVIRSLVRRCNAWRLPDNMWEMFLEFARGLGLDGTPSTVACQEGLHAVIIRSVMLDLEIDTAVWNAYFKEFSTLKEYSLNGIEKKQTMAKLPALIMAQAKVDPTQALVRLENVLEVLDAYKVKADKYPELIDSIATVAKSDKDGEHLLRRLFNTRIARKQLFRENFALVQTDASYLNALRHDPTILISGEHFEKLIKEKKLSHDRFLRSLALYFNEKDGLAKKYFNLMVKTEDPNIHLARAFVIVSAGEFLSYMLKKAPKVSEKKFISELKACAHLSVPSIDIDAIGWKTMGAKAIANKILTCPDKDVERHLTALMSEPYTMRVGFVLSLRIGKEASTLSAIYENKPRLALKLCLLHAQNRKLDEAVWDIVIQVLPKLSKVKGNKAIVRMRNALTAVVKTVPENKRAVYVSRAYEALSQNSKYAAMPMLCHMELMLQQIDEGTVDAIAKETIQNLTLESLKNMDYKEEECLHLRIRIIAKYLLLCKSESQLKTRWEVVGMPFMERLVDLWQKLENKTEIVQLINEFLPAFKYKSAFMNTDYVCILSVIELVINKLQSILPLHEYYELYVRLHLTMIYFKSVRQAIKNNGDVFENLPKKSIQATELVGRIFGRYIAKEIVELTEKYFDSIRIVYGKELGKYITDYFSYETVGRAEFVKSIIYGILDSEIDKAHLLAHYMYSEVHYKDAEEILEILKQSTSMEVRFFARGQK